MTPPGRRVLLSSVLAGVLLAGRAAHAQAPTPAPSPAPVPPAVPPATAPAGPAAPAPTDAPRVEVKPAEPSGVGLPPAAVAPGAEPAAAPPPERRAGYTLRETLALAERNHPNIQASRAKLDMMRAQLDEAHFAPFSQFTLVAGAGPAPTFRGGSVYTQDREVGLKSNLGMAWRASVEGTIPIWTFGKVTNTWRAAEAQISVGQQEVRKTRNGVRLDVRKAYYGLQLARDTLVILGEAVQKLDKALGTLEARVRDGEGDEIDLLRLQTARAELDGRLAEAEKHSRVALAALRFYTGVADYDIPGDAALRPPKHELSELTAYLDASKMYRPEVQMARAGLLAREAQADLARSKLLPDIGMTLFAGYSRAPEITDQLNPFVRDDANYFRYGFGLGMRWSLDFLPQSARVRQADAQLAEMKSTYQYALGGVRVEVEKAFSEAIEAKRKVNAYMRASRYARQWMIKVSQGIDLGLMEERDLVDPARQYALQRFSYLSALLDLNMAMSNLALTTGWDAIAEPQD